jgi:MFS family permease
VSANTAAVHAVESRYAWWRLLCSLTLMTVGGAGMYAISVVLPEVQKDFNVARADASLPYTLTMIGFGIGGILMGKLADRHGTSWVVALGAVGLGAGFSLAAWAPNMLVFNLAQGLLLGLVGNASTMGPLVADTTQWFTKRRGIALAVCMSGNYLAGTVWPPIIEFAMRHHGWRATYVGVGLFCVAVMLPLAWVYRVRPPVLAAVAAAASQQGSERPLGMSPAMLQTLLIVAGVACCVAMAMPQVHIVAYCSDLGIGVTRGAQMLSVMLGMGIISRLVSGWISDHIGGLRTLLLGSVLQGLALLMFFFSDGATSLFVVSALFGLFQGGIVPSYALIVREHFTAKEAGSRVGTVLMATLLGMALGGWMSGAIFDATGSYRAAFLNGIGWNLLNVGIALFLLSRLRRQEKQQRLDGQPA